MKTINKILLLGLLLVSFFSTYTAQVITPEIKQSLIANLANVDSTGTVSSPENAVRIISQYKIVEAIPGLIQNLWKQSPEVQFEFLRTLQVLGSDQAHPLTLAFIDSVNHYSFSNSVYWSLYYKVAANYILFRLGDYTNRNYLYEILDKYHSSIEWLATALLPMIIKNVPEDEQKAKSELLKIANESNELDNSYSATYELYKIYGEPMLPLVKQRFLQETRSSSRVVYLQEFLSKHKTNEMRSFLANQALIDSSNYVKAQILKSLLTEYGSPYDYNFVLQNQSGLSPRYADWCKLPLKLFKPILPDSSSTVSIMVDSLLSYHTQCVPLNWLGDAAFSLQLQNLINDAKTKLNSSDSLGAAFKINQYQTAIIHAYQDPVTNTNQFVTSDGYKFLYYYPKYILERLPKLPIIKTIIPAITVTKTKEFILSVEGNYFRPASVISWNGKPCKTTFMSNTLLQTKIDLNDSESREDEKRKDNDEKKVKDGEISIPVWVTTNKWINTDTLTFRLYKKLPYSVLPLLNCIVETSPTKYEAWFGYDNKNEGSVLLDHESENKFDPAPQERGQPTVFLHGKHDKVFSVKFEGNKKLMWKLDKEKAEASKDSPRCK